jgi:fructosamine-3-kinase
LRRLSRPFAPRTWSLNKQPGSHTTLAALLGQVLGAKVLGSRPLSGGDINQAYALSLDDGRQVFVKTNASAPRTMFPAEARGLTWLAGAATALPTASARLTWSWS